MAFPAGHPSPFGPFSLLQAPWLDPAYFNLSNLTQFGQFGTSMGNFANLPCPPPWDHHHMRRVTDPLALIKGIFHFIFIFLFYFKFLSVIGFFFGGAAFLNFPLWLGKYFTSDKTRLIDILAVVIYGLCSFISSRELRVTGLVRILIQHCKNKSI
jgi:hypothetical protein